MRTLTRFPTKQEEIDHYNGFVEALPRASYLAGILRDTVAPVAELIGNDMAFPDPLYSLWRAQGEAQETLAKLRQEIKAAQETLSRLSVLVGRKRGELKDLASAAELIGKRIRQAV